MLHNHLRLHVALTRRTNGELRYLQNAMLFRNLGNTKDKSTCTLLLVFNGSNRTKTVFPDRQRNQVTVLASRQSTHSGMQDRHTLLLLLQPQALFRYTRNRQLSDRNLALYDTWAFLGSSNAYDSRQYNASGQFGRKI